MNSVPSWTGADRIDGGCYRDKRHASSIHHCWDVTHGEVVCTAAALTTICIPTFIYINL